MKINEGTVGRGKVGRGKVGRVKGREGKGREGTAYHSYSGSNIRLRCLCLVYKNI